jgi:hypothetical protein
VTVALAELPLPKLLLPVTAYVVVAAGETLPLLVVAPNPELVHA